MFYAVFGSIKILFPIIFNSSMYHLHHQPLHVGARIARLMYGAYEALTSKAVKAGLYKALPLKLYVLICIVS